MFTTQEEVGLRGQNGLYNQNPDIAVAVDVTDTGDTPPSAPTMAIELGKGTAIRLWTVRLCDADVRTMMIETAKKNKLHISLKL